MLSLNDKIYCFYFPQFYPTPENDFHWGAGFTDWNNVRNAEPLFDEHRQPRIPEGDNYYNQSEPGVLAWQVHLAKKYGIDGFSFYHYWFDGKLTLEKPLENFLNDKSLDLSFCITWANESWTKRWTGEDDVTIFKQTHSQDRDVWLQHFDYLFKYWSDSRYLKVECRPVFIVYNPHLIKCAKEMFAFWNEMLEERIGVRLHIVAIEVSDCAPSLPEDVYNSYLNFEPRFSYNSKRLAKKSIFASRFLQPLRYLPEPILNVLTKIRYRLSSYELVDYQKVWDSIVSYASDKTESLSSNNGFYGAFVDWDNSPRYKNKAKVYVGSTPDSFYSNFVRLIDATQSANDAGFNRFFFINAWNEWSEGTYLEPDTAYGYGYLEKISLIKNSQLKRG